MAENLFIRIDQTTVDVSAPVDWMLLDEISGVARAAGRDPLSAIAGIREDADNHGRIIVLVPGEDVLITTAAVPSRKRHQIVQALPFVIEERIAADVEQMHFAIGERLSKGDIAVAMVANATMGRWVALLGEAGLSPQVMVPDSLCVPLEGDSPAILIEGGRAMVRTAPTQGLSIERSLLGTLLQLEEYGGDLGGTTGRTVKLLVDRAQEGELELEITQWQAELEGALVKVIADYPPFETLCRGYRASVTNLMQGEFEAHNGERGPRVRWGMVALVAGICLLLHFMTMMGRGVYLSIQSERLEQEALALYTEVFPGDRNVRDIRRRWQAHLSGAGTAVDQGGFLALLREVAKSLRGSGIEVDNINFNEQRGDLLLQVRAASSDQLVAYSQRLSQAGLAAEIGAINQGDEGVNGSVRISGRRGG